MKSIGTIVICVRRSIIDHSVWIWSYLKRHIQALRETSFPALDSQKVKDLQAADTLPGANINRLLTPHPRDCGVSTPTLLS